MLHPFALQHGAPITTLCVERQRKRPCHMLKARKRWRGGHAGHDQLHVLRVRGG